MQAKIDGQPSAPRFASWTPPRMPHPEWLHGYHHPLLVNSGAPGLRSTYHGPHV